MQTIYTARHKLHATDHVTFEGQPFVIEETPARAEVILQAIQEATLGSVAPPIDHGIHPILAVHDVAFITYLQSAYTRQANWLGEEQAVIPGSFAVGYPRERTPPTSIAGQRGYYAFGIGSPILKGTWEAAYWAAQCALTASDAVLEGQRCAYALCRPPGHHAARDLYGGFCYINNAAIAARYLTQASGTRVAVLDVDFHHGNGTQAIFYDDPKVFYASLHADPLNDYPYYWGFVDERGAGPGTGTNLNIPLPLGTDDARYLAALCEALAALQAFRPRFMVLSLGLDIAEGDELGGMRITTAGLSAIGERVAALHLPTIVVQEGGYNLSTLGKNTVAVLEAFA